MKEKILTILEKNSRVSVEDLAALLGTTVEEVTAAIMEMEHDKVICGYHTIVNWDKVTTQKVNALIEVKATPQRNLGFDKIAERLYNFPEVESIYLMSGGFDFAIFVEGRTLQEVSEFVSSKLSVLDSVLSTSTHFVLKKYKENGIILEGERKDERIPVSP